MPNQTFSQGETLENMTGAEVEEQNLTVCQKPPIGGQNAESNVVRLFLVRPRMRSLGTGSRSTRTPTIAPEGLR